MYIYIKRVQYRGPDPDSDPARFPPRAFHPSSAERAEDRPREPQRQRAGPHRPLRAGCPCLFESRAPRRPAERRKTVKDPRRIAATGSSGAQRSNRQFPSPFGRDAEVPRGSSSATVNLGLSRGSALARSGGARVHTFDIALSSVYRARD